jgi:hypothetical protein
MRDPAVIFNGRGHFSGFLAEYSMSHTVRRSEKLDSDEFSASYGLVAAPACFARVELASAGFLRIANCAWPMSNPAIPEMSKTTRTAFAMMTATENPAGVREGGPSAKTNRKGAPNCSRN